MTMLEFDTVEVGTYVDGSIALRLMGLDGIPALIPTVNLQHYGEKPAPGNVFIKTHNENAGAYDTLHEKGVVGPKIRTIQFGYGEAYECEFILPREDYRLL